MEKSTIKVDGMSCNHCVTAVTKAVNALPGIGAVNVDLKEKTVSVEFDKTLVTLDTIKDSIEEDGYTVV